MTTLAEISIENERLRQENARLRAENCELRPRVSELEHKLRQQVRHCETCDYHPTTPPTDEHA